MLVLPLAAEAPGIHSACQQSSAVRQGVCAECLLQQQRLHFKCPTDDQQGFDRLYSGQDNPVSRACTLQLLYMHSVCSLHALHVQAVIRAIPDLSQTR